jgi:adenylate cyclase
MVFAKPEDRGSSGMVRKLRLYSGLVLFAYVLTHLLNHALGLVSLDAMEAGLKVFVAFWRSPPASILFYGAFLLHAILAGWAILERRHLEMSRSEAFQLVFGLSVPPLLVLHVAGTRLAALVFDAGVTYTYTLAYYFSAFPWQGLKQVAVLIVAWLHVSIGLHLWLRLKPWYPRAQPWLYAAALLLPTLALLGTWTAGQEVLRLLADPVWPSGDGIRAGLADPEKLAFLNAVERWFILGYLLALAACLLVRPLRSWLERRHGRVRLFYPAGRSVVVAHGVTILEASRIAGIPHASLCGGRGRCSTCRVRVSRGLETLAPPDDGEQRVLARVGAPPNVRLACQVRPLNEVEVVPLLPPNVTPRDARPRPGHVAGEEREVVILFADLRNFTKLSESKLPYDVVFLLNRYFQAMGDAVEQSGGHIDKFIGDGVMALFAVEGTIDRGCRQALLAARSMVERLDELNRSLVEDLPDPLRIGIGLHVGQVIVGEMGYGRAVSLTAIGDAVNTASRLEAMTKDFAAQLVASQAVITYAGLTLDDLEVHDVDVRGRQGGLKVAVIRDLDGLAL